MPKRRQVLMTRTAISPRLAIRIFENITSPGRSGETGGQLKAAPDLGNGRRVDWPTPPCRSPEFAGAQRPSLLFSWQSDEGLAHDRHSPLRLRLRSHPAHRG